MEQNVNTVTPTMPVANNKQKSGNGLKIATVIACVMAACGIGFSVFQTIENNKKNEEINTLKTEISSLKEQQNQTTEKVQSGSTTIVTDSISDADTNNASSSVKKYLEPEGWNVRFAYPDGVTDIQYGTNDNYDGALYIYSITKNGKTYDVNICGGKDAYEQYPFFLGNVDRWNPNGSHESWEKSPAAYNGMTLSLTNGDYQYYVNTHYGNGCESGENTPDYVEALSISKALMDGIEAK